MADVEMNKGVQILLERMSSNPDEFIPNVLNEYPVKWRDIVMAVQMRVNGGKEYKDQLPFLNDKEIKALWEKMQSLQGELFTKRVMNTLLQSAEDELGYLVDYSKLVASLNNLSPRQQEELSSLSRQVSGGRPKGKF